MPPLTVSVSNLDLFRVWRESEDLDTDWLLTRLRGEVEQSENMKAGNAFHDAIEAIQHEAELNSLASGDYRFDFNCDGEIELTPFHEKWISQQYGDLSVRGKVDAIHGRTIVDYKTTEQFDPDRYMFGYQWRFYLDMSNCDVFTWKIFVLKEFGPEHCYEINQFHELTQCRYPDLHEDCERLAADYLHFAENFLVQQSAMFK